MEEINKQSIYVKRYQLKNAAKIKEYNKNYYQEKIKNNDDVYKQKLINDKERKHRMKMATINDEMNEIIPDNTYFCDCCQKRIKQASYYKHIIGKKHILNSEM